MFGLTLLYLPILKTASFIFHFRLFLKSCTKCFFTSKTKNNINSYRQVKLYTSAIAGSLIPPSLGTSSIGSRNRNSKNIIRNTNQCSSRNSNNSSRSNSTTVEPMSSDSKVDKIETLAEAQWVTLQQVRSWIICYMRALCFGGLF